jgi:hypothetical protein
MKPEVPEMPMPMGSSIIYVSPESMLTYAIQQFVY